MVVESAVDWSPVLRKQEAAKSYCLGWRKGGGVKWLCGAHVPVCSCATVEVPLLPGRRLRTEPAGGAHLRAVVSYEVSPGSAPAKAAVRGRGNPLSAAGRFRRARSELRVRPVGRGCSVLQESGEAGKNDRKMRLLEHLW